jgi:DNA-binding CsgD family transcriptional regulator
VSNTELPPDKLWRLTVYGGHRIDGNGSRQHPRAIDKQRISERQNNRCLYCDLPIGAEIMRWQQAGNKRNGIVTLRAHWDHFVPYAYLLRNPSSNWVLACHVCNGLKLARIFHTVERAREFILPKRIAKGYESPEAVIHRLRRDGQEDLDHGMRRPTPEQLDILRLLAEGYTQKQIAERLEIPKGTVSNRILAAAMRLQVTGQQAAIEAAIGRGFIERDLGGAA